MRRQTNEKGKAIGGERNSARPQAEETGLRQNASRMGSGSQNAAPADGRTAKPRDHDSAAARGSNAPPHPGRARQGGQDQTADYNGA